MSERSEDALFAWLNRRVQRLSRLTARHRLAVDLAIAVAAAALSIGGLANQQHRLGPGSIAFCAALCAPLTLRRVSPRLCFVIVGLVAFLQWLFSVPQLADAAVLISLYWIALEGSLAELLAAALVVEAGAVMAAVHWSPSESVKVWVGLSGLMVAAAVLGITIRQRRALLLSLQEKAARLEIERDQEGRLGAAAERARIAREMHDIVSHNLTVMIALADGAGYVMDSDPARAAPAVQRISATGRQALVEMRRLLGVLRDEDAAQPLEPQPSLDRLDDLLARVHAAGIPVTIDVDGDPHTLSEGVQLTVFRVAQEALTNTLKHSGRPTSAHLALRCRNGEVELEVVDTGHPDNGVNGAGTGGRGLRGMRERAAVYGGELHAGPVDGGGWRVRLRLTADTGATVA